jgi:hypothetical protein
MTRRTENQHLHRDNQLGRYCVQLGGVDYLAVVDVKTVTASAPTIYNVSTVDASWTAISIGLTGVVSWKLTEKSGNNFYYGYTVAPSTYMTGFGWISGDTALTAIYVKRTGSVNIDMQLEIWTV